MLRKFLLGVALSLGLADAVAAAPCNTVGANLVVDGITCQLSGVFTFDSVQVINGGAIEVNPHDGSASKVGTGNLELRATTITIDATSRITAKGRGYQTKICGDGSGPLTATGTGDSLVFATNVVTLTDAAGLFMPGHVGRTITISGATATANNNIFTITTFISPTQIRYSNPAGVTQAAFAGTWAIDDGSAGQGGCAVSDSGGGGAHFGGGGRGTNDISGAQTFPADFEEDCGNTVLYGPGPSCTASGTTSPPSPNASRFDCRIGAGGNDGLPTVAGQTFFHSIYQAEFGASGGDKGCRDGDGLGLMTAGSGGGRIVLAGLDAGAGVVTINGTLDATGRRGCGIENDSGGGGAGGTVVVAADHVNIGPAALITAAGGLGGDTQGAISGGECPAPFQQSGTCDDCGGGGGGGIVSVLSGTAAIDDQAVFRVNGALGGVCPICNGEAGGGDGELQISNGFIGELCDGFDNDFDGQTDEDLGTLSCATFTLPVCVGGVPQQCPADVPTCQAPVTDTRARFAVIVDTSGSMLLTLPGVPTFGDGSIDHPGRDFNNNLLADDSRLFKAKSALTDVISAYPNVDFTLARYHQDTATNRSCQLAHNFECNKVCCTYDNPGNNSAPAPNPACTVNGGSSGNVNVLKVSPGDECINYAGNCGPPRRGADVLVGFGADVNNYLMWLDGKETQFNPTTTPGAFCNFGAGGDCELRGTGPTPLANSLQAMEDFLTPIKACDLASAGSCRGYNVILLTDGAESCQGDPVAAATGLRNKGINTFVICFSTLATETTQLNAIAAAGGTGTAFLVGDENALANALATIVSGSIVFETCNDLDDDCDTRIDEDFPGKGNACTNGALGACTRDGALVCKSDGTGLRCDAATATCNASNRLIENGVDIGPCLEVCNSVDDDCDGKIDEALICTCAPQAERCNGIDDDCDGRIDEATTNGPKLTRPCGTGTCQGVETCDFTAFGPPNGDGFGGCTAQTPTTETCNGIDDNCDGIKDGFQAQCSTMEPFPTTGNDSPTNNPGHPSNAPIAENICRPGFKVCPVTTGTTNSFGTCTDEVKPCSVPTNNVAGSCADLCNGLDDDCDNQVDEDFVAADCSSDCGIGQTTCVTGQLGCDTVAIGSDDNCNGIDDNCNGMIDEGYVCDDPPNCPCTGSGICNGVQSCVNGQEVCQGQPVSQESCDCDDNNCNGTVDEGNLCGAGSICNQFCQCAFSCSTSEFPCPLGKFCKQETAGCSTVAATCDPSDACTQNPARTDCCCRSLCITDPCFGITCPPIGGVKQVCQVNASGDQGSCVDACSTVNCAPLICIPETGECKPNDCTTFPDQCTANQLCINGTCVTNLCQGVECPTDQYCVAGNCVASCADVECPAGQRCRLGVCEADPCDVPCPFGQACNDNTGQCVADGCAAQNCPTGQWCNPNNNGGTCEDDLCVGTQCPSPDQICLGGTCFDPDDFAPDAGQVRVTTGGGGCATSGGDPAGWLLLGLGWLVVRRRGGRS